MKNLPTQEEIERLHRKMHGDTATSMKSKIWGAEATYPIPSGMSREEVMAKFRAALESIGWSYLETGSGFSATTPLTVKSTGERVEIQVGSREIAVKSSGGTPIMAFTSKGIHKANLQNLMEAFQSRSTIARVFNHREFIEKTSKAFALLKAGILDQKEFQQTKANALLNLDRNSLHVSGTSFLMEIAPLVEAGAVTRDELDDIKRRVL